MSDIYIYVGYIIHIYVSIPIDTYIDIYVYIHISVSIHISMTYAYINRYMYRKVKLKILMTLLWIGGLFNLRWEAYNEKSTPCWHMGNKLLKDD